METLIRRRALPPRESEARVAAANVFKGPVNSAGNGCLAAHPRRLLMAVAQQSGIGKPGSCRIILSMLYASRAIRRAMCRELGEEFGFQDNSGTGFVTLIALYALSPVPATAADLACHAEVSRASMADIIEGLEQRGLVTRYLDGRGHITLIDLTDRGQKAAVLAVRRFLKVVSDLAGDIGSANGNATIETCEQIEESAAVPAP
jgi:DNA-binding MarR family transcriptional regulator